MFGLFVRVAAALGILVAICLETPAIADSGNAALPAPSAPLTQKVFAKAYGDWVYRCVQEAPPGKAPLTHCAVMQQIVLNRNGQAVPLITLAVTKVGGQHGYVLNAVAPLGISLPPGVLFWSDKNAPVSVVLDFCQANGCVALNKPASGLAAEFKTGKQGSAQLVLADGRTVKINFSLDGFAAGLAAFDTGALPPEVKAATNAAANTHE